jgi:hypothetical protein
VVDGADTRALATRPDAVATYRVHITAPRGRLAGESQDLTFVLRERADGTVLRHGSVFFGPRGARGEGS